MICSGYFYLVIYTVMRGVFKNYVAQRGIEDRRLITHFTKPHRQKGAMIFVSC